MSSHTNMKYLKEGVGGEGNECITVVDVEQALSLIMRKQPEVVLRGLNVERKPQDKHGQLACLEMHIRVR